MPKSIAFHSYKGGTGKSTIAANLAAIWASRGHKVALIDLDVYAPSLQTYFDYAPEKWINDLLSEDARPDDVMIDMTSTLEKFSGKSTQDMGKLWIGFSNPQKEEIYKLEGGIGKQVNAQMPLLRKFIELHETLLADYLCDYVLIDTSPGVRYWSLNSLAVADTLFLTLKFGELDIEGTRKMAGDIYEALKKFGAKPYLLLNRVAGYCVPHNVITSHSGKSEVIQESMLGDSSNERLSRKVGVEMISAIPCYCDIQFSEKEFLTALQYPNHPFAKHLEKLAETIQTKA